MNPVIQELIGFDHWIGYGVSEIFKLISKNRSIKEVNRTFFKNNIKLSKTDTIILNANNFVERKKIGISLDAFRLLLKEHPNVKFCLHTKTESIEFKLFIAKYLDLNLYINHLFSFNNDISDSELNYIYNCCDIGLQTSTGEGWSLTNCEHQKTRRLYK